MSRRDPRGPDPRSLAISGLLECASDSVAALRTSTGYAQDSAYREVVDNLQSCFRELSSRLGSLGAVPGEDEPAFVLLGRDLDAPEAVEAWAVARRSRDPGDLKIAAAVKTAVRMRNWRAATAPRRVVR